MCCSNALRLLVCAALATLAAGAHAAPVQARNAWEEARRPAVRVTPDSPGPGDEVEVWVTGCEGRYGSARSAAFVAEAKLAPDTDGGLFGEARVRSTARPGEHVVEVSCDGAGTKVTGRLVVAGQGGTTAPTRPGGQASPEPPEQPDDPGYPERSAGPGLADVPTAPVRAGGGGMASAAETSAGLAGRGEGPAGLAVLGCALLGGSALGGVVLAARRR